MSHYQDTGNILTTVMRPIYSKVQNESTVPEIKSFLASYNRNAKLGITYSNL